MGSYARPIRHRRQARLRSARPRDAAPARRGGDRRRTDQAVARRWAPAGDPPRRLCRRARCPVDARRLHRRGSRRRRGLEAVTRGGRARVQADTCEAAAATGDRRADAPSPPPARHRDPPRGPPAPARHHDLRGDPDHVRPARAAGPCPAARAGRAHARLPRGLGAEAPGRRRRRAHARAWIASRIRWAVSCDRARDGCGSASTGSGGPITTRTLGQRHGVYSERVPSR